MNKILRKLGMISLIFTIGLLAGCGGLAAADQLGGYNLPDTIDPMQASSGSVDNNDSAMVTQAHQQLINEAFHALGFNGLTRSEEMHNLVTRLQRQNDPNHISYLYEFSMDGKIIGYYVVRGKCSSTDSQLTIPQMIDNTNGAGGQVIAAPSLDGSSGLNEPGIFCFLDNPQRTMITWSGTYQMSDTYLPMHQVPLLTLPMQGTKP